MLRRQLESVNGVGQVLVLGGRQRQINVWLDADRLRAYNLTVTDVARALQAQNVEIPGGRVDQGAAVGHAADARPRPERSRSSATSSSARQTATRSGSPTSRAVEDGEADADTRRERQRRPAPCCCSVRRQSGTNTVEVVDAVKERLDEIEGDAAARLRRCASSATRSEFIEASIHNVEEHLIVGSILAALVVLLFLGEPALDDHRGDRDSDVDHRDLRPDLVHGLHAQHR